MATLRRLSNCCRSLCPMNWACLAPVQVRPSGLYIPSMYVARPIWPRARAPKPPRNSRRFSITAASWPPIPSAHWHTCNWAEHSPCRATRSRQRPPTRLSSPFGKTPTPTSRSSSKPNRNTPGYFKSPSEIPIDSFRRLAPLGDGPHHQRLPAAHVAGREDARHTRHVIPIGRHIAAPIQRHAYLLDHAVLHRAGEAHGEQHQIGLQGEFRPRQRFKLRRHAHGVQLLHVALFVAVELHRVAAPTAHAAFFVRAFDAQLHRPQRPRRQRRARVRRLGQEFELRDGARALPMAGAQTIGAGIAAPDDDHAFPDRKSTRLNSSHLVISYA